MKIKFILNESRIKTYEMTPITWKGDDYIYFKLSDPITVTQLNPKKRDERYTVNEFYFDGYHLQIKQKYSKNNLPVGYGPSREYMWWEPFDGKLLGASPNRIDDLIKALWREKFTPQNEN